MPLRGTLVDVNGRSACRATLLASNTSLFTCQRCFHTAVVTPVVTEFRSTFQRCDMAFAGEGALSPVRAGRRRTSSPLFGRAASRDFVDVHALRRRFTCRQLEAFAAGKDRGFSLVVLRDAFRCAWVAAAVVVRSQRRYVQRAEHRVRVMADRTRSLTTEAKLVAEVAHCRGHTVVTKLDGIALPSLGRILLHGSDQVVGTRRERREFVRALWDGPLGLQAGSITVRPPCGRGRPATWVRRAGVLSATP